MAQIDLKNCTIKIKDGTATPNEVEIKVGEGNLTYSERRNIEYKLNRGVLDEVREGDQVPVQLSFDLIWEYVKSATGDVSVIDALKKTGEASTWTSSDSDACRPYAVDVEVVYAPTPSSCGDSETFLFSDFRWEQLDYDLRAGTISCSGQCNILAPTVTRSAQ